MLEEACTVSLEPDFHVLLQYMVAYELLVLVAVSTIFKFDGSRFSVVQVST